jgi:hypothetical protein
VNVVSSGTRLPSKSTFRSGELEAHRARFKQTVAAEFIRNTFRRGYVVLKFVSCGKVELCLVSRNLGSVLEIPRADKNLLFGVDGEVCIYR